MTWCPFIYIESPCFKERGHDGDHVVLVWVEDRGEAAPYVKQVPQDTHDAQEQK